MTVSYNSQKTIYNNEVANIKTRQAEYNKQVSYWNDRGGAQAKEFTALEKERKNLESLITSLNKDQDLLNSLASQINTVGSILNELVKKLNLKVFTYNTTSSSTGEEFSEGEYISNSAGQHINIYQFENNNQLVRILTHELGHSLGLEHVDDPNAIMYRLNSSKNQVLTAADIAELNKICKN